MFAAMRSRIRNLIWTLSIAAVVFFLIGRICYASHYEWYVFGRRDFANDFISRYSLPFSSAHFDGRGLRIERFSPYDLPRVMSPISEGGTKRWFTQQQLHAQFVIDGSDRQSRFMGFESGRSVVLRELQPNGSWVSGYPSGIIDATGVRRVWVIPYYPAWLLGVLLLGLFALKMDRRARIAMRLAKGLCPVCGYDLCATPDRCPECGAEVPAVGVEEFRRMR